MDNADRHTIREFIAILNERGRKAAEFFTAELEKDENGEAWNWVVEYGQRFDSNGQRHDGGA
ncbi:MAG TPA: hypothetical protein VGK33_04420 [Chloroflexota bacterium]|jgi:hypothetical protein